MKLKQLILRIYKEKYPRRRRYELYRIISRYNLSIYTLFDNRIREMIYIYISKFINFKELFFNFLNEENIEIKNKKKNIYCVKEIELLVYVANNQGVIKYCNMSHLMELQDKWLKKLKLLINQNL